MSQIAMIDWCLLVHLSVAHVVLAGCDNVPRRTKSATVVAEYSALAVWSLGNAPRAYLRYEGTEIVTIPTR
jgi:hypothetical protein